MKGSALYNEFYVCKLKTAWICRYNILVYLGCGIRTDISLLEFSFVCLLEL